MLCSKIILILLGITIAVKVAKIVHTIDTISMGGIKPSKSCLISISIMFVMLGAARFFVTDLLKQVVAQLVAITEHKSLKWMKTSSMM